MRRSVTLAVFFVLASLGGVCHAAPPKAPSLRDAWQNVDKKCGLLLEKNGTYQFTLDETIPGEGETCILSVGTDAVLFGPNSNSSLLDSPRQYLIVPLERIVLSTRQ
jgi:hypothetical protein